MITDGQTTFSLNQALSATANSTNVLDLTQATRDIGVGEPMAVCITVSVALAGTSPTFVAALVSSASSNLSSPTTLVQSQQFSTLAVGARIYLPVPPGINPQEFLGIVYTLGGTTPSVTVTAVLVPLSFAQADTYGASGINVQ